METSNSIYELNKSFFLFISNPTREKFQKIKMKAQIWKCEHYLGICLVLFYFNIFNVTKPVSLWFLLKNRKIRYMRDAYIGDAKCSKFI